MIDDKDIANMQTLFQTQFGITLSREQALAKAVALVGIMRLVYTPITQEQLNKIEQWRKDRRYLKNN